MQKKLIFEDIRTVLSMFVLQFPEFWNEPERGYIRKALIWAHRTGLLDNVEFNAAVSAIYDYLKEVCHVPRETDD